MSQDSSLFVMANDIKAFERLKVISQIAPIKERIKSMELKYGCDIQTFETKMKVLPEDFDRWDDFIEWKAYSQSLLELEARLKMIEDAKDIRIASG